MIPTGGNGRDSLKLSILCTPGDGRGIRKVSSNEGATSVGVNTGNSIGVVCLGEIRGSHLPSMEATNPSIPFLCE